MEQKFDEIIRKDLMQNAKPLPASYTDKIATVLENLPDIEKKHVRITYLKYAVAALVVLMLGSSGAYAAVNLYQSHLSSMSLQEKEALNEKTQKQVVQADRFSRELSEKERNRMELLQEKYENDGLFPEEKICEVDTKAEIVEGELSFCYENSTFYLPKEELTDEELLRMIDFWERRDYAVKEKNEKEQISEEEQEISEQKALQIAETALQELYQLDVEQAKSSIEFDSATLSDKETIPSYLVSLDNDSWSYSACVDVDATDGIINSVTISHKKKEECVAGIKVNEKSYAKYINQIYDLLTGLNEKKNTEEIRLIYKYREDGTLNRGNIKYVAKLKDGSAYVFLYSVNTKMVYQFYKMTSYEEVFAQEKKNEKLHKQAGILTKNGL